MRICLLCTVLFLITGSLFSQSFGWDQSAALSRPGDQLVNSMVARLLLAREVAWSKFCNHAKVRDLAREARVLADLKAEGVKIGLSPEEVSAFFKPQIVASCRFQEELIAGWASGLPRPTTPPKDLRSGIRPLIDTIDRTLLLQWKEVSARSGCRPGFDAAERMIEDQGIPAAVAKIAARPLASSGPRSFR